MHTQKVIDAMEILLYPVQPSAQYSLVVPDIKQREEIIIVQEKRVTVKKLKNAIHINHVVKFVWFYRNSGRALCFV